MKQIIDLRAEYYEIQVRKNYENDHKIVFKSKNAKFELLLSECDIRILEDCLSEKFNDENIDY